MSTKQRLFDLLRKKSCSTREILMDWAGPNVRKRGSAFHGHNPSWVKASDVEAILASWLVGCEALGIAHDEPLDAEIGRRLSDIKTEIGEVAEDTHEKLRDLVAMIDGIEKLALASKAPRCRNCAHAAPHDGPAGDVNDACAHPGCGCGFDSRDGA